MLAEQLGRLLREDFGDVGEARLRERRLTGLAAEFWEARRAAEDVVVVGNLLAGKAWEARRARLPVCLKAEEHGDAHDG